MKYISGVSREQLQIIPTCLEDCISEDNPVRVVDAFVDALDLSELGFTHAILNRTGRPAYDPGDLLKLYLYGHQNRIRSSRRLEKEACRNIEVMWLVKGIKPDFKTIADFRRDNKESIRKVFKEFVLLCKDWGLLSDELIVVDGSKFRAWNGKKRNFNQNKLNRKYEYIDAKIKEYMDELDQNDQEECEEGTLENQKILKRIEELKARRMVYESYEEEIKETGETQVSLTDPDSRTMQYNQKVEVCYNIETTVEEKNKLIIDYEVINKVTDSEELFKMSKRAKDLLEVNQIEVLADKGFYKATVLKECVDNNITPYISRPIDASAKTHGVFKADVFIYDKEKDIFICPAGEVLPHKTTFTKSTGKVLKRYYNYETCRDCKIREQCTKAKKNGRHVERWINQDIIDEIEKNTQANLSKYKKRQAIVEHPFGTIKRGHDSYYLLTKGFKSVSAEIGLIYCAYNLKRVSNILGVRELVRRLRALCLYYLGYSGLLACKIDYIVKKSVL